MMVPKTKPVCCLLLLLLYLLIFRSGEEILWRPDSHSNIFVIPQFLIVQQNFIFLMLTFDGACC